MLKKVVIILALIVLALGFVKTARFLPIIVQLIFNREINIKKSDGAINILALGVGGANHEGPDLSDTIIYASINTHTNTVNLVSLPRDLWIPDLSGKINTAYAIGKGKEEKEGGFLLAKAVVSKVVGKPIDYAIVVDFDGFVKAVDLIGGLDVSVDNTFDDYQYPVEGKETDACGHSDEEVAKLSTASSELEAFPCRYMHAHFDKGQVHMDGKTALIFVRSRHAEGDEGTDFARSRRQQKVISAFKDKLFSAETLLNPIKISSLYSVLAGNIATDIPDSEIDDFVRLAQQFRQSTIHSNVIDIEDKEKGKKGLLVNPPLNDSNGIWMLIPKTGNGNYSQIQAYVSCLLTKPTCEIP